MASSKTTGLPKRFRPLLDQANTEAALRYGGQEAAFGTILGQLTKDRERQLKAQATANATLLGSLNQSDQNVNRYYSDAGLSPTVLSSLAGSPTGQRLAGEMASYRSANQQGLLGAQAGNQFQVGKINDQFGDNFSQLKDQLSAEQKERGLFTQSTLEQLIGSDRSARHDANVAAAKTAHDDAQSILDREATSTNALIGQGLLPDASGNLQPLPGGKADPNAPGNKPKRTTGPGTASKTDQLAAGNGFKKAFALAKGMATDKKGTPLGGTPGLRDKITGLLTNGVPGSEGKVVYEDVPVLDVNGKPTGKTKRQPKLDSDGNQITTKPRPELPSFDAPIAAAAAEQALLGYVTTKTVRELQGLGYSVNQIPGLKTENQARAGRKPSSVNRPNSNLGSDGNGQQRPT